MAWTLLHESALLQEEELSRQHLLRQELKQRQAGESPSPFFQTECFIRIRSMSSSVLWDRLKRITSLAMKVTNAFLQDSSSNS